MKENCDRALSIASSVSLAALNGVSGFLAIAGNAIFLLTLSKTPALQTTANYFIASLAWADLCVGLFANSLYVALSAFVSLQDIQRIKEAETFLWLLTTTAVTFNLCFVAVERYFAIVRPLRYSVTITTNRLIVADAVMWVFAVLFAAVSFYLTYDDLTRLWITAGSFVTFLLPLVILLFFYLRIFQTMKARSEQRKRDLKPEATTPENPPHEEVTYQEELKNTKAALTFAVIPAIFVVLFLPTLVVNFMGIALKRQCHRVKLNTAWFWVVTVSYASSAINPLIYAVSIKDYRQAAKRLLRRS